MPGSPGVDPVACPAPGCTPFFPDAIRDESGGITGVVLVFRDVTERKQTELALKESGEFLRKLLNAIPAPIFYKDTEGRYLGINKSFEEFYGLTYQDVAGKSAFDIAPQELAEVYHAKDLELLRHPGLQVYESQGKDARGVVHDVIFYKAACLQPCARIDRRNSTSRRLKKRYGRARSMSGQS